MHRLTPYFRYFIFGSLLALIAYSCANMASPAGGLYDEAPPKPLKATPGFNALNVKATKIQIEFDENIKIEKPQEKIIITPPQINLPVINAIGRKAVVELNDTLLPNTTYTIDFTDAIVDNNEGNALENFSLSFSTGDHLDTLAVSGKVLIAENLEPAQGIYIGIHSNLNDTAFTHIPFDRISRTDSRGSFTIRGMKEGKYHIFALDDKNRDYKYDNPQETIAFLDTLIVPSFTPAVRQDTIFNPKDSLKIDTIKEVHYTRFLPDDIVLRAFSSDFQRKYLQKIERPERHLLDIFFGAPTEMPTFSLLNPEREPDDKSWYVLEQSKKNDSLTFWITDSLIYKTDTIRMQVNYLRTDSVNLDYIATDTLSFNYKPPKETKKKEPKKKGKEVETEEEKIRFLGITSNIQSTFDIFNSIHLEFEQPIMDLDSTKFSLFVEKDSVFTKTPYTLITDSMNPRKIGIVKKWDFDTKYKFAIDSAVFHSYYGLWNDKVDLPFTIKKEDAYGNLEFSSIIGLPQGKTAYIELLDKQDKPFRRIQVKNNRGKIQDLLPGTYYFRLFIDENGDGKWTTGDYEKKRLPEPVYYYPRSYEIRAFSDYDEIWDLNASPLVKQKPLEITKNKPEEKKKKKLNQERNNQTGRNSQQNSNRTSTSSSNRSSSRLSPSN